MDKLVPVVCTAAAAALAASVVGVDLVVKVVDLEGVGVVAVENKYYSCCTLLHQSCCFVDSMSHSAVSDSCLHTLPCHRDLYLSDHLSQNRHVQKSSKDLQNGFPLHCGNRRVNLHNYFC